MKPIASLIAVSNLLSGFARIQRLRDAFTRPGRWGGRFRICYALQHFTESCAEVIGSQASRLCVWSTFGVLAFLTIPAFAGTAEQSQLFQAQELSNQGEFAQVIRVLEPLVHSEPDALDDANRGWAWNTLGSAHQDLGDYEAARRCYEAAIRLLRTIPGARSTYASTLANLGSLEISMGQMGAAETSLHKAKGLYVEAGNRAGLTEIAISLATLAIRRNDNHAARGFLADAFREAETVKDLALSDQASMYSIKGSLAARARDFAEAVSDYQRSIDFWIQARGPKCYIVGAEYAFQADAYRELGDYGRADSAINTALILVEQTVGRNTPLYAATELTYARLLRATGAKAEGAKRDTEARATLEAIRRRQCNGCSVSAASLR
jgi:tetratricopeptide (TPR) repeat protein